MIQSTSRKVKRGRIFPEIQWSEEQKKQWQEENEALRKRCFPIFEKLKKNLIKTHYNWYIAIEAKSEDYVKSILTHRFIYLELMKQEWQGQYDSR